MLERPSAQNITAFENESTVSDENWVTTWNQLKRCFWKKVTGEGEKKDKGMLTGIQVLTKDFTSYKIRYKSSRKTK